MSNVPKLRFKEFNEDWKNKKFKDFTKVNQGLQIPIAERFTSDGENRYFYITNEFLKCNSDINYYIEEPPESVICDESDILMTRTGNTGKVVTGVKGVYHNNFFKINYDKTKYNKIFLYNILISPEVQKNIIRLAGTSTIPDLNHGDFYSLKVNVPKVEEQEKIADFLSLVDEKILLQADKVEALKEYKKGIIQKIFNQEIRFKDENGNEYPKWKNIELSRVLSIPEKIKEEKVLKEKLLTVKLHRKGVDVNKNTDTLEIGSTVYYKRKYNQLIYGKQNIFNGAIDLIPKELDGYLSSGDVPTLNINNSIVLSRFILDFMGRRDFYKRLESLSTGTGSKRVHEKALLNIYINLPCIEEQKKISNFLSSIDLKIEKEEEKLEQLNEYKKGLLQQMFV